MKFLFSYNEFVDNSIYKKNRIESFCNSYNGIRSEEVIASYISEVKDKIFLNRIIECLRNNVKNDISSQTWACEILEEEVYISFMYDLDNVEYSAKVKISSLLKLLLLWSKFLEEKCNLNYKEIIEID